MSKRKVTSVAKTSKRSKVQQADLVRKLTSINRLRNDGRTVGKKLKSSNLKEVFYDEDRKMLTIHFNSGRTYQYKGVSKYKYTKLITASSHGTYFNNSIKWKHTFTEI